MESSNADAGKQELLSLLKLKREGNPCVHVDLLRQFMTERGLKPEDIGTTLEELHGFLIQDSRWKVERDLENWRLTNSIGHPEGCFAEGVCEALRRGGLKPEEFGITDIELGQIKRSAGP